jgi:NADH:ubiquinone oxidoreductase subunit 3 (subunit A)
VKISIEQPLAVVIVAVLIGLAGYFGFQQWRTIRRLKQAENLHPEDRRYHRRHAGRVFICCVLMFMVAGMVGGWYMLGLERSAAELGREASGEVESPDHALNPNQQRSLWFFTAYWVMAILLLLAMVYVAFMDLWAVRRFGLRQIRQLQADRRAMLERQIELLRAERIESNGHQE